MNFMFWVWLGVIIVTAIIEFVTFELITIWFTVGAIVPLILSLVGVGWEIQVAVFIVLSLVLIFCLRGVVKKLLLKNAKGKTNLDAVKGEKFRLLSDIEEDKMGTIKVNGVVWNCVSVDNETIKKDEFVTIEKVSGSKFVVSRAKVNKASKPEPKKEAEEASKTNEDKNIEKAKKEEN